MERRGSLRSLWQALDDAKRNQERHSVVGRLRGRHLFRASVRLVLVYRNWINENESPGEIEIELGKTPRKNYQGKQELTLQDRSILLIAPSERSKENRAYIWQLMKDLKAFQKYEEDTRESLSYVCRYQYVPEGRVIVRQGHEANALYFIVKGEVALSKIEIDEVTGDASEINVGKLEPGDIFGEITLMHRVPRSMTILSKTTVDLLSITREHFDKILKATLLEEWDILRDAMVNFNYFKGWDESTIRECCILSKVKNYKPNEVIIGDGKGMVNYAYFILSGECKLIEHIIIQEIKSKQGIQYKKYTPKLRDSVSREKCKNPERKHEAFKEDRKSFNKEWMDDAMGNLDFGTQKTVADFTDELFKRKQGSSVDPERISIVTATLQDVVTQWHEITEVAAMLMKKPSTISQQQYPKDVQTIFMQICIFYRGACFALGEKMQNRRIVSISQMRCLLIPRYWLLEKNRANIWERVKLFIDSKYPVGDELFQKFVKGRRWEKFKKDFVEDIIANKGLLVYNDTNKSDVPYSTRINEV